MPVMPLPKFCPFSLPESDTFVGRFVYVAPPSVETRREAYSQHVSISYHAFRLSVIEGAAGSVTSRVIVTSRSLPAVLYHAFAPDVGVPSVSVVSLSEGGRTTKTPWACFVL